VFAVPGVTLCIDAQAHQKSPAFARKRGLETGNMPARQQVQFPERDCGTQKFRLESGFPAKRQYLLGPPDRVYRTVLAIGRARKSDSGSQIGIQAILDLHYVSHIEMKPNRVVIVDHQPQLAGWFEQALKLAEQASRLLDAHQYSRTMDIIERRCVERQIIGAIIDANELRLGMMQLETLFRLAQRTGRDINAYESFRARVMGKPHQVVPWAAAIVQNCHAVLAAHRQ